MHRWIEDQAAARPHAVALHHEGKRITYAALRDRIAAAAAMLAARGLRRGDRLGFLGQNHPSQLVLLFACARLGAVQVPLNWRLAAPELRFILEDSCAAPLAAAREMAEGAGRAALPRTAGEGGARAPRRAAGLRAPGRRAGLPRGAGAGRPGRGGGPG